MAESKTTHIVEVVAGQGEPSRLPLALGLEQSPVSVGKNGMWRVTAGGVLDAHVFLYFDGRGFFVQSADAASPALANGVPVDTSWTEMAAPCTIEFGGARLVYREVARDEAVESASSSAEPVPLREDSTAALPKAPTRERPRPSLRPAGPSKPMPPMPRATLSKPPSQRGPSKAPPPNVPSQTPPPSASSPMPAQVRPPELPSLTNDGPPSIPGFTSFEDGDDSTRVAPLDAHSARTRSGGSAPNALALAGPSVPPALGSGPLPMPSPSGPLPMPGPSGPLPPPDPSAFGFGPINGGAQGYGLEGSQPLGPTSGSPMGARSALDANVDAPQGFAATASARAKQALATWRAWPLPRKALSVLLPVAFIGAIPMLFEDDPPPQEKSASNATASADSTGTGAANAEPAPTAPPAAATSGIAFIADWPADVPCPPPNWPADRPPPCTPNGVSWTPPSTTPPPSSSNEKPEGTAAPEKEPPKAPPMPAGTKTLERQAVDLYAAGDYLHAAEKYDELAAQNPSNRTYAEAARIARTRASGKSP